MSITMGLKLGEALRQRLRASAERIGRTPHWIAKQALLTALDHIDHDGTLPEPLSQTAPDDTHLQDSPTPPFLAFARSVLPQGVLRARITSATRRPEPECLPYLIDQARSSPADQARTRAIAVDLVAALRRRGRAKGAEGLLDEYSLSSQEGVALMCLAEALLRIPDAATRDALIRDKIAAGDWQAHVGHSPSLFVNAATWGLVVTGKLTTTTSEAGLSGAITRAVGRGGEPLIRRAVAMAMRLMGEQFVAGQTIGEALASATRAESRGYRYSYDMLGEAATTAADADRYYADYERAIRAIGHAAGGRGIYEGPGISIKLSALHPRFSRGQYHRVMQELLPRLRTLAILARGYDIGLNIDAEESERLELSLDLLEALCFAPELAGWNGVGFVVQAYGKRCPFVIDWLIDLARRGQRRLMVRLVKGAYWDSEIKRAQINGLEDFPVYTRKLHTDVSYLACARRLLGAPDAIYPQFATHNAQTLAAIAVMAGNNFYAGQYEFQCLHGMGEPLYDEVVGSPTLNRPCRIYAPVGTHETLLAYLVRRLLENGANTSFVNRVADATVPLDDLVADPVEQAAALSPVGAPHPRIALPRALFGTERPNAAGVDLDNEQCLASLSAAMLAAAAQRPIAAPLLAVPTMPGPSRFVTNPADRRDTVGSVVDTTPEQAAAAVRHATAAASVWSGTHPRHRAACLRRAADLLESRLPNLVGLIVREAGKTLPAAVSEVREAVDFLRCYAAHSEAFEPGSHRPLGPVVCISPWNFPLAIFIGQIAAALAAGNSVLAKPAEQTPLIAHRAVSMLHEAGIPPDVLQYLPGDGRIGATLVDQPGIRGVVFTGSTTVARLIQRSLAKRLTPAGQPIVLIAETGGQNAMVVDSSALAEQVVTDVLASAFDSAGQRCSALRILCLQDDIAERTLAMLRGAMHELSIGNPDRLSTDCGPVIDAEAQAAISAHVTALRAAGHPVTTLPLPSPCRHGSFVVPTLIEIDHVTDLQHEVFGPVLHVLRFRREALEGLIADLNATGYGLTFGLHTRIDETIDRVTAQVQAGNIYVNRNIVGAVVGVQPFGGQGLSGTGPKAGGPLYLHRLLQAAPSPLPAGTPDPAALMLCDWIARAGDTALAAECRAIATQSLLGTSIELPGPVGERNTYSLHPLGRVLCLPRSNAGTMRQLTAALATGNTVLLGAPLPADLPPTIAARIEQVADWRTAPLPDAVLPDAVLPDAVLFEGDSDHLLALSAHVAAAEGPIVRVQSTPDPCWLLRERVITNNVAAAGGNASLMTIG